MKRFILVIIIMIGIMSLSACVEDEQKYTLFFNVNGGIEIASIKVPNAENITLPIPEKGEDVFAGWFLDREFTEQIESPFSISEDTVVYAKWILKNDETIITTPKENLEITFVIPDQDEYIETIPNNSLLSSFPEITKNGYDLLWFSDENFFQIFDATQRLTDDVILYGKWTALFIIENASIVRLSDYGKTLSEIVIPEEIDDITITSLSNESFRKCEMLEKLTISKNIETIEARPFFGSNRMENIFVEEENAYYISVGGVLYSKEKTTLVSYPKAKPSWQLIIAEETTTIMNDAFGMSKNIVEITLPASLVTIEEQAFSDCTAIITFTEGIAEISQNSFSGYAGKHINLSNITKIGDFAFKKCINLTELNIPSSVNEIGQSAFLEGKFPVIFAAGSSMTKLHRGAFRHYYYQEITLPDNITEIGEDAFRNSSIQRINLPSKLEIIANSVFQDCRKLQKIILPDTVKTIGNDAFHSCFALNDIKISSSLETIGARAFYNCAQLEKIELPGTLNLIRLHAFTNCEKLKEVYIYSDIPPQLDGASFFPFGTLIYVNDVDAYSKCTSWNFLNNSIKSISDNKPNSNSYLSRDLEKGIR